MIYEKIYTEEKLYNTLKDLPFNEKCNINHIEFIKTKKTKNNNDYVGLIMGSIDDKHFLYKDNDLIISKDYSCWFSDQFVLFNTISNLFYLTIRFGFIPKFTFFQTKIDLKTLRNEKYTVFVDFIGRYNKNDYYPLPDNETMFTDVKNKFFNYVSSIQGDNAKNIEKITILKEKIIPEIILTKDILLSMNSEKELIDYIYKVIQLWKK